MNEQKKQEAIVRIAQMNIADELKERLFKELLEETTKTTAPTVRAVPAKTTAERIFEEVGPANFSVEKTNFTEEMKKVFIGKATFKFKNNLKKATENPVAFKIFGNPKTHLNTYRSITTYTTVEGLKVKEFQVFVFGNFILVDERFEDDFKAYLQGKLHRVSYMRNQRRRN